MSEHIFSYTAVSRQWSSWGTPRESMEDACRLAKRDDIKLGALLRIADTLELLADHFCEGDHVYSEWQARVRDETRGKHAARIASLPWPYASIPNNASGLLWRSSWHTTDEQWEAVVDMVSKADPKLLDFKNFGKQSLENLKAFLSEQLTPSEVGA